MMASNVIPIWLVLKLLLGKLLIAVYTLFLFSTTYKIVVCAHLLFSIAMIATAQHIIWFVEHLLVRRDVHDKCSMDVETDNGEKSLQ